MKKKSWFFSLWFLGFLFVLFSSFSPQKKSLGVEELLSQMTLEEKIGQIVQINKIKFEENPSLIRDYFIGSILSGGGDTPKPNQEESWATLVDKVQKEALKTRLKIPLFYGIDAVHGHGNAYGATIFPHNIALGATRNPNLVRRVGEITALELARTGIHWNFAPAVSVPRDIRWGRTYEGYSENTKLVSQLSSSYLQGLQKGWEQDSFPKILGTVKHFVGDGGTQWGSSTTNDYKIDQGEAKITEENLRKIHLPPYIKAIKSGAQSLMVSYSSWAGKKMHAHKYLLTDVLKSELGFKGFVISDWAALDQLPGNHFEQVVAALNAGIDMFMLPYRPIEFIKQVKKAMELRKVTPTRLDDAVRRILKVKLAYGLFKKPLHDWENLPTLGNHKHRDLARQAVRESLVLLKNKDNLLPLSKNISTLYVVGSAADDIGIQCGGWTLKWQGERGRITEGTSLLEAIRKTVSSQTKIIFLENIKQVKSQNFEKNSTIIVAQGEEPYAEGLGDKFSLTLTREDKEILAQLKKYSNKIILVLFSGRPLVLTEELVGISSFVAAWLPGTEGLGLTDVIFGNNPFQGKLSFTWPKSLKAYKGYPFSTEEILFPFGSGL